jgi:iron complex outermembrane receptor protein
MKRSAGVTVPLAPGALLAVSMFASLTALAQTLPPVTVTATRTEAAPFDVPASVDVVGGERIRGAARAEVNLSEAVGLVPGLAVRERQNYAQDLQLSIRGFGARSTFGVRGVRLYVDGIPATLPDGQGQLSHIDLSSAGRIEVLRGPFSVLYGNSSGGVVQVFTDPGEGKPSVTTSYASGSDGLSRPGLRLSGAAGALGYVVSASGLRTDGYRDHSAASRDVFNARLDWKQGEGDWTFVANSLDLQAQDLLGLSRAQFEAAPRSVDPSALAFDTRKSTRQSQLGVIHEHRLAAGDRLRVMVYAGERQTEQFQAIPVATQANPLHPGGVIGLDRDYAGADIRWTSKREVRGSASSEVNPSRLEWVAGLSYDTMREHRRGWQNFVGSTLGVEGLLRRDEDNRVANFDPYLQAQWQFAPGASFTAGVRHSRVRFSSADRYIVGPNGDDSGGVSYSATLPAAALMVALTPDVHAYAAVGRGFETPTFNELAYRPDGTPGLNLALAPSRSTNFEAGLKGRSGWSAALFDTRTSAEIVTQTNSGGRSTFRNAGATRRRGAELAWSANWSSSWRLQFAQTWLQAIYRDSFATCTATPCSTPTVRVPAGNRIPGTARSTTAAELAWAPANGWQAGIEARRVGRVFVNDANSDAAPAFTTLALNAGYVFDLPRWTLAAAARVDNLAGRRYAGSVIVNEGNGRYFEPAPGRTWTMKLSGRYAF